MQLATQLKFCNSYLAFFMPFLHLGFHFIKFHRVYKYCFLIVQSQQKCQIQFPGSSSCRSHEEKEKWGSNNLFCAYPFFGHTAKCKTLRQASKNTHQKVFVQNLQLVTGGTLQKIICDSILPYIINGNWYFDGLILNFCTLNWRHIQFDF